MRKTAEEIVKKAIAEVSGEFPYAIEASQGDVSGEGDYVTTLVVWRN